MADDVKARLIEVAGPAFAERGYDAVGIREICQQAGANVAAVNYHFGDKQGLYYACLRRAQSCRVEHLTPPHWPADFTPADKLRTFIHDVLEMKLDPSRPPWHQDLMLREMSHPTEAGREVVEDYIRPMTQTLGDILQELLPGSSWNQGAWLIGFSIVSQALFHQLHQPVIRLLMGEEGFKSLNLDVLTEHISRFSLAALGHAPPMTTEPPSQEAARSDAS